MDFPLALRNFPIDPGCHARNTGFLSNDLLLIEMQQTYDHKCRTMAGSRTFQSLSGLDLSCDDCQCFSSPVYQRLERLGHNFDFLDNHHVGSCRSSGSLYVYTRE